MERTLRKDGLYTAKELGKLLKVDPDFIRREKKAGRLPGVVVRSYMMFCGWQVMEWLDGKCAQQMEEGQRTQLEETRLTFRRA